LKFEELPELEMVKRELLHPFPLEIEVHAQTLQPKQLKKYLANNRKGK